ncbi:MAG: TonB family protein [Omnitrophica bacterium]|nr:TonB family protein [Candidatus Omnitrophota bacterium]
MRKRIVFALLIVLVISVPFLSNNYSQSFFDDMIDDEDLKLVVGEVNVFKVAGLKRVAIRNPEVADVIKVVDEEVVVAARRVGDTVLTIWDNQGKREFYIVVFPQDVARVKQRLQTLINGQLAIDSVYLKINETAGKVMIMGEVTISQKEHIEKVLSSFFGPAGESELINNLLTIKEESRMVEVECQILELTKHYADSVGFNWSGTTGGNPTPVTTVTSVLNNAAVTGGTIKEIFRIFDATRTALDVEIMATVNEGKGKVLARPKLLCLSGQEAEFLVGGEVPVITVTATSAGSTVAENVEYKEYGVKLNMRPLILGEEDIKLDITAEVKELTTEGQYVRVDGTIIKAFATRTASTVLLLKPNQSIVISGLLKDKVTKDDIKRVPGLASIPILGALFRSRDYQEDQTELIIFLTPNIVDFKKRDAPIIKAKSIPKYSTGSKLAVFPSYLQNEAALNDYILRVQRMIVGSLEYPRLAEEAGWQGAVKLRVHLGYDGEIIEIRVTESSGYVSFDNNVMSVAKNLSPYPPFPPSIELEDLWIDIPIVYKMD